MTPIMVLQSTAKLSGSVPSKYWISTFDVGGSGTRDWGTQSVAFNAYSSDIATFNTFYNNQRTDYQDTLVTVLDKYGNLKIQNAIGDNLGYSYLATGFFKPGTSTVNPFFFVTDPNNQYVIHTIELNSSLALVRDKYNTTALSGKSYYYPYVQKPFVYNTTYYQVGATSDGARYRGYLNRVDSTGVNIGTDSAIYDSGNNLQIGFFEASTTYHNNTTNMISVGYVGSGVSQKGVMYITSQALTPIFTRSVTYTDTNSGNDGGYFSGVSNIYGQSTLYICGVNKYNGNYWRGVVLKTDTTTTSPTTSFVRTLSYSTNNVVPTTIREMYTSSNVVVAGYGPQATGSDQGFVAVYNSTGTLQWQRTIYLSGGTWTRIRDAKIDSTDDSIILFGTYNNGTRLKDFVIKIPSDGSLTGTYTVGSESWIYTNGGLTSSAMTGSPTYSAVTTTNTTDIFSGAINGNFSPRSYSVTREKKDIK